MKQAMAMITAPVVRLLQRFRAPSSKRVLVHEILWIQILSAGIVGAFAIGALYWGGQWVLQDNYSRWALQWTEELNELGSPLYLSDDSEALLRVESFVKKYPEIGRVAYFRPDGAPLFSIDGDRSMDPPSRLPESTLEEAKALIRSDQPYLLQSSIANPREFEILAPVWTESLADDGLFAFDPAVALTESKTELIGFVGMHLDFILFHDRLLDNIKVAILIMLALLSVFALYGRRALRRALASISDLQDPIQELARGNLKVKFEPAEHREISDIVEALETTATALSERDAMLMELANHDNLTGLYNRRRFMEELNVELANIAVHEHRSALFFIDLDQFKYVNDTCGHHAGDRLIRKVADELTRSVSQEDIVARFGGDEFVILHCNTDEVSARDMAERMLASMRRLAHVEDERVFHIHCSIGVTMIDRAKANPDEIIAEADIACREAKSAGRNRMQFFEKSSHIVERATSDVGWMNRLRNAVDADSFELRFQPINRIDTGATTHHEVLLRLRGDDGKLLSPDAFLPSAVRFGLMSEIDLWTIRHSAEAYAEYIEESPKLKLSINLSANAFESDNLADYVASVFAEYRVPANRIIFEITESLAVRRPRHVELQIDALREMGCKLALDDFGTGYSSFSYLQKLHFDFIKIDGSFVHDIVNNPVDQKMIKLIAEVGREANMRTVAEYVQDAESLELLGELGVDLAQGFFVGRPSRRPLYKSTPISLSSRRNRRTSQF
ncbi:MAG TPA: EAL domain-containing protein [Woeseiaceae bacterium]|nr:EAL domain-containing protein [Woeseiaceae bacterium]